MAHKLLRRSVFSFVQGETRLGRDGAVGSWDYRDFRSYCSPAPSNTELYYTYISSFRCSALEQLIDLLEADGDSLSVDLLIFSSLESGMRR
jgi:non-ribosomal peptide synthetase component F